MIIPQLNSPSRMGCGHVSDLLHPQGMKVRQWWEIVAGMLLIFMLYSACSTKPIEQSEVLKVNPLEVQQEEQDIRKQLEIEARRIAKEAEAQILAKRISELLQLPTSKRVVFDDFRKNPDINALVSIGKPAVPHLIKIAHDHIVALMVLGEFGADALDVGPRVKELAETLDGSKKFEALITLSKIGYDPEWTYETLKSWINRKPSIDRHDKQRLIYSLARFDPQKFDVLLTLKNLIRGNEEAGPLSALETFGMLGVHAEPEIPFLLRLKRREERIGDRNEYIDFIPTAASEALAKISVAYATADPDLVRVRVNAQVRRLFKNMSSSREESWDATEILLFIGEPAVPQLIDVLGEPAAALNSSIALDLIGDRAVSGLVRHAKSRMPDVSNVFDKFLAERKDSAVHFLVNLNWSMIGVTVAPLVTYSTVVVDVSPSLDDVLKSAAYFSPKSRSEVVEAFALPYTWERERTFVKLAHLVSRSNQPDERRFATLLLAEYAAEAIDVLPGLLICLIDRDPVVAANATSALKRAGKPGVLILARALADRGNTSKLLQRLQVRAIAVLGEIGDADALPLLERRFRGPDHWTKDIELSAIKQIRSRNKLPPFNP